MSEKKLTAEEVLERAKAYLSKMTIDDIMEKYNVGVQYAGHLRLGRRFPPRHILRDIGVTVKRTHVVTFDYVLEE